MTGPDATAGVPDEPPARAIAAAAHELAYPRPAIARDFDRAERVLHAVAAAGWVLVPGPVHTEWRGRYSDGSTVSGNVGEAVRRWPNLAEYAEIRQATEWRPATEPIRCDATYPVLRGWQCEKPAGHTMPHLTMRSGSADTWAEVNGPESEIAPDRFVEHRHPAAQYLGPDGDLE